MDERWRLELEVVQADDNDEDEVGHAGGAAVGANGWCTELFSRLRGAHSARVEWCGWRAEPFMFGLQRMVLIATLCVDRGGDASEASDEVAALVASHAGLVQAARVSARARVGDDPEDDAFRTCRRLFLGAAEEQAGVETDGAPPALSRESVRQLLEHGYVVLDDFVPPQLAAGAARLIAASILLDPVVGAGPTLPAAASARPARTASPPLRWRWPEPRTARGDCTAWVGCAEAAALPRALAALCADHAADRVCSAGGAAEPPADGAAGLAAVISRLEGLQAELLACARPGRLLGQREVQLACYAPGSCGYRRHTDALPDDGAKGGSAAQRKLTAICYCNGGWTADHGGALRLTLQDHQGGGGVDVAPVAGRCLVFMAGCMPHEVLPSAAHRYAVTAWYW